MKKFLLIVIISIYPFSIFANQEKITYHENGEIKTQGMVNKEGKKHGKWVEYSEYGELSVKVTFENGELYGEAVQYYLGIKFPNNMTDIIESIENRGKENVKWRGYFKNGKREGRYISYYKAGQIEFKGFYKDGEKDGEWIEYYQNSQIKSKGKYKDGEKDGEWILYNENGNINYKINYNEGIVIEK